MSSVIRSGFRISEICKDVIFYLRLGWGFSRFSAETDRCPTKKKSQLHVLKIFGRDRSVASEICNLKSPPRKQLSLDKNPTGLEITETQRESDRDLNIRDSRLLRMAPAMPISHSFFSDGIVLAGALADKAHDDDGIPET